jgi:hypothetical protein
MDGLCRWIPWQDRLQLRSRLTGTRTQGTTAGHCYWWWGRACRKSIPFMECTKDATIGGDGSMRFDVCPDCGETYKCSSRELTKAQVPHRPAARGLREQRKLSRR